MKKVFSIVAAVLIATAAVGAVAAPFAAPDNTETKAKAKKTENVVFTVVPTMTCQNCENKIKTNMRFEKGVKGIVTDIKGAIITVTYNPDETTPEKLAAAFKKIGYTATVKQ